MKDKTDTLDAYMLGVADGREAQTRVFKEWLNNSAVLCRENPDDNEDYCYVISKEACNKLKEYLELIGRQQ